MFLLLNYMIIILSLGAFMYTISLLFKNRPKKKDAAYLHLFLTSILMTLWLTELPLIDVLYYYHVIALSQLARISSLFQIFGMISAVNISIMLNKQFTTIHGRVASRMSMIFFSGSATLLLSDYYFGEYRFLQVLYKDRVYFKFNAFYAFLVIIGSIFLGIAIFFAYLIQKKLAVQYYSEGIFTIIAIIGSTTLGLPVILFFITGKFTLVSSTLTVSLLLFPNMFTLASLVFAAFKLPFLNILGSINTQQAIKNGFIGYLLSLSDDLGPQHVLASKAFMRYMHLTDDDLFEFTIRAMTVLGSMDARWEGVYLIPFAPAPGYIAFSFNFVSKNPLAKDTRLQTHTPVMLTILLSKMLHLKLHAIDQTLKELNQEVNEIKTIQELVNEDRVNKLVTIILNKILDR